MTLFFYVNSSCKSTFSFWYVGWYVLRVLNEVDFVWISSLFTIESVLHQWVAKQKRLSKKILFAPRFQRSLLCTKLSWSRIPNFSPTWCMRPGHHPGTTLWGLVWNINLRGPTDLGLDTHWASLHPCVGRSPSFVRERRADGRSDGFREACVVGRFKPTSVVPSWTGLRENLSRRNYSVGDHWCLSLRYVFTEESESMLVCEVDVVVRPVHTLHVRRTIDRHLWLVWTGVKVTPFRLRVPVSPRSFVRSFVTSEGLSPCLSHLELPVYLSLNL